MGQYFSTPSLSSFSQSALERPIFTGQLNGANHEANMIHTDHVLDIEQQLIHHEGANQQDLQEQMPDDILVRPDKIIAICGQMGTGKDTLANILTTRMEMDGVHFKRMAFADPIKKLICQQFEMSYNDIEEWKRKAEPPPGFQRPVRDLLQHVGDMRTFDPMLWVKKLLDDMPSSGVAVITDVRYENELEELRKRGAITVLVTSSQWPRYDNTETKHSSETGFKALHERIAVMASQKKDAHSAFSRFPDLGIDYYVCNDSDMSKLNAVAEDLLKKETSEPSEPSQLAQGVP